jgi:ABC-2 type transport system permease protein
MTFGRVLVTEFAKLRRAKITWFSWLAFSVLPLVSALFMWIVKEPHRAAQLGLLGQKARFAGVTADWPSYFGMIHQGAAAGGMILLSIIAAYVFGREYAEGTAKNMLALPVSRHWFVLAKLVVSLAWFAVLTALVVVEGFVVGALLNLPGFSPSFAASTVWKITLAVLVSSMLVPTVTWIATLGRGYLAPLGFTIFMCAMGNAVGMTGWAKWFPWSIVPLFAGMAGPRMEALAPGSLVVVALTGAAGLAATLLQLRYADNTQ